MASDLQSVKRRFDIIGRSEKLDRALSTAVRIANTELSVLIIGESGVGKEVFSKIIHSLSARKHNEFIAINTGAIPEGTINSELFGHEKGAFTGSAGQRKGYFETVDGGTIFLDEIGEMPLATQAFLLRILENGEFTRVGSSKVQKTDVRVIAATNKDLNGRIQSGKFREDLYYRLSTVVIEVPPLRERREDIYMLFRKFSVDAAEKYRRPIVQLDDKARLLLENYNWPGNIRELKNVAEQVAVLADDRMMTAEALLHFIPNAFKRNLPAKVDHSGGSESFAEREILYKLLFDMKNDLNDLKSLVFGLIRSNNLDVADVDVQQLRQLQSPAATNNYRSKENFDYNTPTRSFDSNLEDILPAPTTDNNYYSTESGDSRPQIIYNTQPRYDSSETVDENLSLEDNEKQLIKKALKKHNNRRKDAAEDLGISERTLYRKIKQYEL
ncbi:MAG: sigma-54 interaction domain-containing protein [Saprospiraceae bacterium]